MMAGAQPDRAEAMARRLDRTAARLGMTPADRDLIGRAFRLAMGPRRERITSDHHPDYLHPARTALILMDDVRLAHAETLATALFTETRDPGLAVDAGAVERISEGVARELARIPIPDLAGDTLLETLLALPEDTLRVAAAERLDHARHLHLRDRTEWDDYHETTCHIYVPVARRTEPVLAGRLEWWCTTFTERFLDTG